MDQLKISLDNKILELNNIKGKLNLNSTSKDLLFENILKKEKEIEELKLQLSRYPIKLNEGEKLISVIFTSTDQKVNYSIICKNTDKFSIIEDKLYENYTQLINSENYFIANGKKVYRYRTLDENGIHNNSIIILKSLDI